LLLNRIITSLILTIGFNSYSCDFCDLLEYGNTGNKNYFKLEHNRSFYKGYNTELTPFVTSNTAKINSPVAHRGLPGSDIININHEDDFELYTGTFLSFNYNLKNRWNLRAGGSFISNTDNYGLVIELGEEASSSKEKFKGLGDLWLGAERIFTIKENLRYRQVFKLGGVVNLPTGKFDVENVFTDNLHMQPGRSVYGLEFNASYNFEEKGFWGINAEVEHYRPVDRNNLPSTYTYKYAKEISSDVSAYKIFNGTIDKILIAGIRNEYSTTEFVNGLEIGNTGGYSGSINTGFGLSFKKVLFQGNFNIPVIQKLNSTQLKNKYGINLAVFYYFGNKSEEK